MKSKIQKLLYPEEFEVTKVYSHFKVIEELETLIEEAGTKDKVKKQMRNRIKFLDSWMNNCVFKSDWFESLKNEPKLYSMIIKSPINLRIIFMFSRYKNRDIAILLTAFIEKNKSDYKSAILVSKNRMNEL